MVVALTSLFVALGGTGYAATHLGHSPGATTAKKHHHPKPPSDAAADAAQIGRFFSSHKNSLVGPRGPRGTQGVQGVPGPVTGTLPSGATLSGTFDINQPGATAGAEASTSISFGLKLSAAPTVHYIRSGAAVPTGCSGTASNPGAASGNLCIFEVASNNGNAAEVDPANPVTGGANVATTFGAAVSVVATATGSFATYGSWAVTG
jgi:hypothetical protein